MKRRNRGRGGGHPKSKPIHVGIEANWQTQVKKFDQMELQPELLEGISSCGFEDPYKIQALSFIPIHEGHNVIAQASSGSGKTTGFCIGILSRINVSEQTTQALILSPIRELVIQTFDFIKEVSAKMNNLKVSYFIGGDPIENNAKEADLHPHIVVATPGRALDLLKKNLLHFEHLKICCLDEADKLLDQSFIKQTQSILSYLNPEIQLLLFSVTDIYGIVQHFVKDPIKIVVNEDYFTLDGIKQFFVDVNESQNKLPTLIDLLRNINLNININKAIIFANKDNTTKFLQDQLESKQFLVSSYHTGLTMNERKDVLEKFRLESSLILIASDFLTDIIDVQREGITFIFNFELPDSSKKYLHRIGKSARYGCKSFVINIIDNTERKQLKAFQREFSTTIEQLPTIEQLLNDNF